MNGKRVVCALLLSLVLLPAARADVLLPGQKPPRNEQSEAFIQLYADGLTGWDSAYETAFDGVDELVLWRYPGSGEVRGRASADWFEDGPDRLGETFDTCYVDDEGRFWGYLGYLYGQRMNWVCLSDPDNADLAADSAVVAAVDKAVSAMRWRERGPAIAMVAGVVVVTGGLLYAFWYKKKPRETAP